MRRFFVRVVACAGLILLVACAKTPHALDTTAAVHEKISNKPPAKMAEGSLWPGDNPRNILFTDAKAKEVGDIVTVVIEEDATSTQSATTDTSKETDIDFQTNTVLGIPTDLGIDNFLGFGDPFNPSVNASTSRSNQGAGTTSRLGRLSGTVTVIVTNVYPNGNLSIAGSRTVAINNEKQIMNLQGTIRPMDINFDNTISSRFIANAAITYTGNGIVADEQRAGWLTRILSKVWPF